ncbi:hypothetical protein PABG_12165 [Paracoccidioides brasiliensis Pb03]|uniref:Uncharacterized protein n=2 Tax=Paracoccidioides brasiliensis TaxID=121759 RepID=A0A0A0HT63_PARBD|nr:uncharacterized protein PADG_11979 [Paracoccidioides brasiliensis Pb18]KGM91842.1 hypothetical protein PADG_11979 [Paracoccidioides brasiliensis Pb18]KGY14892.1 hypothetical protein PABG_12165 [Paracoccidioides brasiliensis Pb03]ODH25767.1 hypothetical protein ACO22_05070 [Paracoccidioides brasiliensis]
MDILLSLANGQNDELISSIHFPPRRSFDAEKDLPSNIPADCNQQVLNDSSKGDELQIGFAIGTFHRVILDFVGKKKAIKLKVLVTDNGVVRPKDLITWLINASELAAEKGKGNLNQGFKVPILVARPVIG